MDQKTILYSLEQVGLSEKEAAVYVAALEVGKGTAQEISKKSGIKRATAYVAIDVLMQAGLMSSVHEGKKKYFIGENPDRLVDFIHKKEVELQEKKKKAKDLIASLKEVHQTKNEEPMVKHYIGREGVLAMVKSILTLNDREEIWGAYPADRVYSMFTEKELQEIKFKRVNNTIKNRVFYTTSGESVPNDEVTQRIQLDKKKYPLPADVAVYGDNVRLASLSGDVHGIIIKNKDIATTLKTLFRLAWSESKNRKPSGK